jgi:hypothetical protein|tara:strand:- start:23 stop:136 length:114 start_codon:yes stop_codon:yes gene_type:complete
MAVLKDRMIAENLQLCQDGLQETALLMGENNHEQSAG